ncbi:MAG: hypothetical protein OXF99_01220 [bacterium]|nr:hypothetical protein [bacterium]
MSTQWSDAILDEEPRLIVGTRKATGKIDCYRIDVHEDAFDEFRDIANQTLLRIQDMTKRPYAHFGALEMDEYFSIDTSSIPIPPERKKPRQIQSNVEIAGGPATSEVVREIQPVAGQMAEALRIVSETDLHPPLSAQEIRNQKKFNLYMISFPHNSGFQGFLRKSGPQRSISPGFRYFQYGDTLKRVNTPDFIFDDRIDLIIKADEVQILSESVVDVLFRDVQLFSESVPNNISKVVSAFGNSLPLTEDGMEALSSASSRGPRAAKRLNDLAQYRLQDLAFDSQDLIDALTNHQLDHLLVNGHLDLQEQSVPDFLDFLEGRLFHDDHTKEPRRADRFSRRP